MITRFADARVADSTAALAAHLHARGVIVLVPAEESAPLDGAHVRQVGEAELIRDAQLIIAIGGDGTLLYAAGLVAERGTPLLGINRGRLGFLTDVMPQDMIPSVDAALEGRCEIDQRSLLSAQILRGAVQLARGLALNDVVLHNAVTGHLLDFSTAIDGRFVNNHGGDGLVIATATGSTAYALSCGGPIVEPQLDAIVVAPICPHTLSDRPIVVSGTATVEVRIAERPDAAGHVSCDGRALGELLPSDRLLVRTANRKVNLLHPSGYDYFRLLRSKLNWGRRSFDA
ncbi:MAG: NAD(+)/NADH kinase [Steroidobacteraceae bacterium]|nr:NAD(+)/NADH kinase [Steroidobacteraceae bacterium]